MVAAHVAQLQDAEHRLASRDTAASTPQPQAGENQLQWRVTREDPTLLSSARHEPQKTGLHSSRLQEHRGKQQRTLKLTAKSGVPLHSTSSPSSLKGDADLGMWTLLAASMPSCL